MARFAAIIEFNDVDRVNEIRPTHREYLAGLVESGKIYASGPWLDNSGALLVFDVADEAEARELLAADPYGQAGVVSVPLLKEWRVVMEGTAGSGTA